MVLVQKLSKKPETVVTVKDLSGFFNDRLMSLTRDYDEIILVFDTYREESLKSATRDKRTYVQICVSVAASARTMRTHKTSRMKVMMMMTTTCRPRDFHKSSSSVILTLCSLHSHHSWICLKLQKKS